MAKIDVTSPLEDLSSSSFDRLRLYRSILSLLDDVKLSQGPEAVRSTLRRHPVVFDYLLSVQKSVILDLESKINMLKD